MKKIELWVDGDYWDDEAPRTHFVTEQQIKSSESSSDFFYSHLRGVRYEWESVWTMQFRPSEGEILSFAEMKAQLK